MEENIDLKIQEFMDMVKKRNGHEPEFIQAVQEVAETVIPYIMEHDIMEGREYYNSQAYVTRT